MKEMKPPRGQKPERCKYCGAAMTWYGEKNGIIGWHLTFAGANTDTSDVCAGCRVKELRGKLP